MEQQLVQVLEKTISSNQLELREARVFLENAITTDYASLVLALSRIMADEMLGAAVRMQAGLQLKNVVRLREIDPEIEESRWLQLPADIRAEIKARCCQALATQEQGWHSAAQCVARVACVELPGGHWPGVMALLVANITGGVATEALKQASLEAIGYICNDIDPDILASQSDQILTGILFGMKREEPSNSVRLAATQALLNSLENTRYNFDNENDRNNIMQVVCEATQSADENVSAVALQCLAKLITVYENMELYNQDGLVAITKDYLKTEDKLMIEASISFWKFMCQKEMGKKIPSSRKFCNTNAAEIMELLRNIAAGEDEELTEAAKECRCLFAQACKKGLSTFIGTSTSSQVKDMSSKLDFGIDTSTGLKKDRVKVTKCVLQAKICIVCYVNAANRALACGHLICGVCVDQVEKCPLCRHPKH